MLKRVINNAMENAKENNNGVVNVKHLVISLLEEGEGIATETNNITINGGNIKIESNDDGLNAAGDTNATADSTAEYKITINGGYLYVCAGGDGIDSNGDIEINGGTVYVDGPSNNGNSAIDFGERSKAIVNGGTLVAVGSSGMAEEFDAESTQGFVLVRLDQTAEEGSLVTLTDESGKELISYTAAKTFNCVEISCAELIDGQTYILTVGETSQEIEI